MKRIFKKALLGFLILSLFAFIIIFLPKYPQCNEILLKKKRFLTNNENDYSNSVNKLCHKNNFSLADAVASHYMQARTGKVECDILNASYFVQINDHSIYDTEKKSINYALLKILQNQGVINGSGKYLKLDSFYSIRLNMSDLVDLTNTSDKNIICKADQFDKILNQRESLYVKFMETRLFSNKYDHTLYFKNHGYYHVSCYISTNTSATIYEDSFLILPRNMSILVEERKYYKSLEIKESKLSNDGDEEDIKFLKEDNTLKIDKKMNVLMTGFDSLSYQHFQRV
jgi:hypothetical protein